MEFLQHLEQAMEPVYQDIISHAFNTELAEGTLPEKKFRHYISQDMVYIGEYSRALAALAAKAPGHHLLLEFITFAKEGLEIERDLHEDFSRTFNIQYPETITLATEAYSNFLLSTVAFKNYPEGLAALLPCFWLYNKVAVHIHQHASGNNPYEKWINTYSGAEFDETTKRLKEITQETASRADDDTRKRMEECFIRSALYEWYFWDSAYHLKNW